MTSEELQRKLIEAYSGENLNKITVTLINLYKEKQFGTLRQIAEMISESVEIVIDPEVRYFSKLMMLYHPDRGDFHRKEIDKLADNDDYDGLLGYSHILLLGRIEEIAATLSSYEDIDYSPVYEWDVNMEGFTVITVKESGQPRPKHKTFYHSKGCSFYDAVKIRMYGRTNVNFPPYYLEDTEEFELSQSDINDLDGVQYCIHATILDLSDNTISDISLLWDLGRLEELNLADNKISDIDTLANLRNLKTLNLSNNPVRDVSSLFNLDKLDYIDVKDTCIPDHQIRKMEELGMTVVR
jgi:Leucine-rich repeat (LRR) protein